MHTKETLNRLRWHAGFEEIKSDNTSSVSDCTWLPNQKSHRLPEATGDVLRALTRLNGEINRVAPAGASDPVIAREVVYAVNEILRMLREAADKSKLIEEADLFRRAERQVFTGWNAIVAGDIEDLEKHIVEEDL